MAVVCGFCGGLIEAQSDVAFVKTGIGGVAPHHALCASETGAPALNAEQIGGRGALSLVAGLVTIAIAVPVVMRGSRFDYWDEVGAGLLLAVGGVLMLAGGLRLLTLRSRVRRLEP